MARRAAAVVFSVILAWGCTRGAVEHPKVVAEGDVVRLDLESVDDGRVHFFTFVHDGKNVNFLIRTDGAGRLHSHLDACYSCFKYKRGFVVEDQDLVCIACRLAYHIDDEFWDFIGACAPIPIHSSIDDGDLVIDERILVEAARYF
jgi:uncharacterized membrane protein